MQNYCVLVDWLLFWSDFMWFYTTILSYLWMRTCGSNLPRSLKLEQSEPNWPSLDLLWNHHFIGTTKFDFGSNFNYILYQKSFVSSRWTIIGRVRIISTYSSFGSSDISRVFLYYNFILIWYFFNKPSYFSIYKWSYPISLTLRTRRGPWKPDFAKIR